LVLSTKVYGDEIVQPSAIDEFETLDDVNLADREIAMAEALVDSLSGSFEPERYHDTYREQVVDLIERKAAGETIEAAAPASTAPAVIDLMAALEASVQAAKSARARHPAAHEADVEPVPVKAARKRKSA
jgi:DNA end-binding protein Ku